jgi:aminopeptidase N
MLPRDVPPRAVRRLDFRVPDYLVDTVALTFELDPAATFVTAELAFRRNPLLAAHAAGAAPPLVLDGEHQQDVTVALDGVALARDSYTLSPAALTLHEPPAHGRLTIRSRIEPAANVALEGLYVSSGVFCTQCEPEGFRRITYFPDRPDVLAVYTVTIIAERARYPVLLSNGNPIGAGDLPGGRHFATWHDPFPKPTYLFALVAGDLVALEDSFQTVSGRRIALAIYSTPANLDRCTHAMASLKRAMRWDEERFGREYDLDAFMIFCADDFNLGAMENKGLNIFNSKLVLARSDTATDADYQAIENVIAHEYLHNWTGNRVTCRDWFQLSLKEGLTVFRDQEFAADMGSRAVVRIAAVEHLRAAQFPEDAGPMAHPVRPDEYLEINNFYTATVYEKGAEVIRMLHTLLGPERFRAGMDLYFARHDGQAVTCDDFVQAMQDVARGPDGVDLGTFRRWYAQAGTPVVSVRGHYDEARRRYTLEMAQRCPPTPGQPVKEPFHIPVAVGLIGPDGCELALRLEGEAAPSGTTRVLELTAPAQTFRFDDVPAQPVPSLLRGFSAPVRLEHDYTGEDLALLAAHDTDPYGRWDAAQRSYGRAVLAEAQRRAAGAPMSLDRGLTGIVERLLDDATEDPALLALALAPPDLAYLAGLVEPIDVDALVAARDFVSRELARALRPAFLRGYLSRKPVAPYAPSRAQIGTRALRNRCLAYLATLDDEDARALAVAQYGAADNMTDALASLAAINHSVAPERDVLFARFEAKWQDEPLVLDKWFALQATSHRADTLRRVEALLGHPKFNARNPNRVRSLLGAFALHNWPGFHAAGGAGYDLTAAQAIALDRANPHISSLLAGAFNSWRRFAEPRRSLQREALARIAAQSALSSQLREIVTRDLVE